MELLCIFAALAVLFLFCAFLTLKCNLHAALAPLSALGIAVAWLTAAGMANLLLPGTVLLWAVFAGSGVAAGQRITAPVSLLDLGPTVCDWAGADPLPEPDGQSLVAVLRGESADADRTVWSEIVDKLPQGGWTYSCMARHGQQKFITCHRDEIHNQLFDVIADPDETTNLADAQPDETAAFAAAAARRVDFAAAEALQKRHATAAAVLAKAETGAGGDDRERYRDYPSAAKEAPQYCVTNLTSAPGKSQTYEFYGLPDVNN